MIDTQTRIFQQNTTHKIFLDSVMKMDCIITMRGPNFVIVNYNGQLVDIFTVENSNEARHRWWRSVFKLYTEYKTIGKKKGNYL